MRTQVLIFLVGLFSLMNYSQTPEKLAQSWDNEHISTLSPSEVRHTDLKLYIEQLKKLGVAVGQVGVSIEGREIYQVEWGRGPLKVFMWSQMHGDEPTATSALVDMFAFLQKNRDKDWVKKIADTVTVRAVPMVNPDGAEVYQRRNSQGIDINRDALNLKTPEARLLKQLRDDWRPAIGFNLHNQGSLTTVGRTANQAAISFLVVFGDEAKTMSPGHERNRRITAAMVTALQKFVPGNIARYSDEWSPTAFGDNFSAWGTPVILVETGGLDGRDDMFLVKMNFVAFLTALNSVATGSEKSQDVTPYLTLSENGSGNLYHFIFRGANIITTPSSGPFKAADIAVNTDRRRAGVAQPGFIRGMGDLKLKHGLAEYDASGFNVIHRLGKMKLGEAAELSFYRKDRTVDWTAKDLEKQFPPDAIFSSGKWLKGERLVAKK